jgi:hypothetical protein
MNRRGRKSNIPTLQPSIEKSVISYKDHKCIFSLCSANEIFDRFKHDNLSIFKSIRNGIFDLENIYVKEDDCLSNLGLGKRPYVNTHMCVGCYMLRNLFPGVKIPEDGTFTVQTGKYEGKKAQIFDFDDDFFPYIINKNLALFYQKISQQQIKLNLLDESQFLIDKKIKFMSSESKCSNYIITSIFLNNKMDKYKIPNRILFEWSYSCGNSIKLIKNSHYNYSSLVASEVIGKNIKSATAQVKISPINEDIVFSILKQLVCILHFYNKYTFIHGRPCLEYLNFTTSHCKFKYGDMEIDSPITLHIDPSLYTSFSYETDEKTRLRMVSIFEEENTPRNINVPIESIDISINQNSKQINDNYEIPMINELKKHLIYCYKIGNKNFDFIKYQTYYGIPILSDSFEFYCFLISLIFEDSFYSTFMENSTLIYIWENLWKNSEFEEMTLHLSNLKKKDVLSHGDIVDFISCYHIRTDVIKFFYESLL